MANRSTIFKCPICNEKYAHKPAVYNHIERKHINLIPEDIEIPQYYFNMKYKKDGGKCVICRESVEWNPKSERYNRFCNKPKCREDYREQFKQRMINKYGKIHLLNDPKQQMRMLNEREISGTYRYDSKVSIRYVASYELDFLKFLDNVMDWDANDIMQSEHVFYYDVESDRKFYIPDFFIPSLNLVIEIKDGGDNPNMHPKIVGVDKVKEKAKDEMMKNQTSFNYIKITDKDYSTFLNFLKAIKNKPFSPTEKDFKPIIILGESYSVDIDDFL